MALPLAAVALLKSPTLWKAGGLLAVASAIFIGGCNYGAAGKKQIQAEFNAYKREQAALIVSIQRQNAQQAIAANERLKKHERELEERNRQHQAELAQISERLRAVRLDAALVQLLNDSAGAVSTGEPFTGPNQQANGTPDEETAANKDPPESEVTLLDLAEITIENNKNHLACIQQVEEWQKFYTELYKKFESAEGVP